MYCSLTKMRKIIPKYFTAYARLVTKTFGCAWSGLTFLWMHPQVSNKAVASSLSVSTAEWEDGHGLFSPGPWLLSLRHFLSDPWVQAFPSSPTLIWYNYKTFLIQRGLVVIGLFIILYRFYTGAIQALYRDFVSHSPDRATESGIPSIPQSCPSFHKCTLS